MNAPARPLHVEPATVEFTLDHRPLKAFEGETILQAARRAGVEIPHLCYQQGYRPDGNCRACVVEIQGERTLAPSCCRTVSAGMQVQADSPRARASSAPRSPHTHTSRARPSSPKARAAWPTRGAAGRPRR